MTTGIRFYRSFLEILSAGPPQMEELSGLREDKLKAIRSYVRLFDDVDAAGNTGKFTIRSRDQRFQDCSRRSR